LKKTSRVRSTAPPGARAISPFTRSRLRFARSIASSAAGPPVGGMMSESLGVNLAMATAGPLGFGIAATIMSRKGSGPGVMTPPIYVIAMGIVRELGSWGGSGRGGAGQGPG
jgi:hypothetical protein